ncbi:MAG: helix-turn-helix domain-containing protein [Burkholderiales bacterium]|nr:helix-turn-helix domain-containing protein [Burkholderiales bacterium]
MYIQTIGKDIQARRKAVGLTQVRLARLANLSRQTVQRLEAGTIEDLSFNRLLRILNVLGLTIDGPSIAAREKKPGLWMAANTSSVSYKHKLSEEMLRKALATGQIPVGCEATIAHFIDETPIPIVVMAVEETAQLERMPPSAIWSHVAHLADQLGATRRELWK